MDENTIEASKKSSREVELEKEIQMQDRLIQSFQQENEALTKTNKELKKAKFMNF